MIAITPDLFQSRTLTKTLRVVAILGTLLLVPGCALISIGPLPDTVQIEVEDAVDRGFDGIIVYVDQSYEPSVYAAGVKNREDGVPVEPDTLFKIASISKLYIAAATAKLVHDGALSLDNTLAQLMPELVGSIENAETITLRLMLQHRSGIPSFTDQPAWNWVDPLQDNMEAVDLVAGVAANFDPDRRYGYSNTNYVLIGEILDRTLGYSHHQYIEDEILIPLTLDNTYSQLSEVDLDEIMSGYYVGEEWDYKSVDYSLPGGSMVATAEDVGRFLRALIDGSLFNGDEQMIYSSVYSYEHTGELGGYQSIARYHADIDAVVVQFTNVNGGDRWSRSEAIYRRIVRILRRKN